MNQTTIENRRPQVKRRTARPRGRPEPVPRRSGQGRVFLDSLTTDPPARGKTKDSRSVKALM